MNTRTIVLTWLALLSILAMSVAKPAVASDLLTRESVDKMKAEYERQASAEAIAKAFRSCLIDPELGPTIFAELEAQMKTYRPLAFVNGYWVKPVNLSALYANPAISNSLDERLGGDLAARGMLAEAVTSIERGDLIDPAVGAGLVFIPHDVGVAEGMMDIIGLTDAVAGGAFLDDLQGLMELGANDFWVTFITSGLSGIIAEAIAGADDDVDVTPGDEYTDQDSDDWDDDGVSSEEDAAPFDPGYSITHCPPPGVCFSTVNLESDLLGSSLVDITTSVWVDLVDGCEVDSIQFSDRFGVLFAFPEM